MSALDGSLHAAIDMSAEAACFALARPDGSVICRTRKPMKQREASALAGFLLESLGCANRELDEIGYWTIGSGPGSFTGMRLAAALVAGLTRGRSSRVRCVPTAVAIADTLPDIADGAAIVALFDGRNHEIIAYELTKTAGGSVPSGESSVLDASGAAAYFAAHADAVFVTRRHELDAVLRLTPESADLRLIDEFDPALLISASYQDYDGCFSRLEYIRPAVFPKAEATA
ncbi:MAG: hypothetical protein AB7F40_07025 [Victivallaceae bacterium]